MFLNQLELQFLTFETKRTYRIKETEHAQYFLRFKTDNIDLSEEIKVRLFVVVLLQNPNHSNLFLTFKKTTSGPVK